MLSRHRFAFQRITDALQIVVISQNTDQMRMLCKLVFYICACIPQT